MPISRPSLPRCPECDANEASLVYEKFGIKTFSCGECDHSWRVEPPVRGRADQKKQQPSKTKRLVRRT